MDNKPSIFTPPACDKVTIGGEEYSIFECRPFDMKVWGEFIDQFKTDKVLDSIEGSVNDGELKIDFNQAMGLFIKQPEKVCELLAIILDPEPWSREGAIRRLEISQKFMGVPVSELTDAMSKWIKVNTPFFAQAVRPLLENLTPVLMEVSRLIFQRVVLLMSSSSGNA
jgi:hypothetical protein